MRRAAVLLVSFLLAVPLALGGARQTTDWKALPYFNHDLHELYVSTGSTWSAARVVPAGLALGYVPSWASDRKLTFAAIWARTCARGDQTVSFSRTFEAPGAASSGTALLQYATSVQQRDSINSVVVLVNGTEIGRAARNTGDMNQLTGARSSGDRLLDLPAAALRAFRFGQNTLTIRASKAALPRGMTACNTGRSNAAAIGVALSMLVTFRADMSVGTGALKEYVRAVPDRRRTDNLLVTVRNAGPAVSVEGVLHFTLRAPRGNAEVDGVIPVSGSPFQPCVVKEVARSVAYDVLCPYRDFPPGGTSVVTFRLPLHVPAGIAVNFSQASIGMEWFLETRGDPRASDNRWPLALVLCGPQPTDPGCAGAD